ncbi:XkdN-like tail assembly chaperone [Fontibacillus phaseoli]|uniref:XkdN-like tail assembly chaperone n=1 Tax=Fontibacillus phaseoli TaxID=1416533 RepID=A0A369BMY8_9BACL|nr:hypothetical protein [Fontibacillus phaseoli]RCX22960.1 XkdN-like tail assembly chaperone [Fontibacillus phaseoli]
MAKTVVKNGLEALLGATLDVQDVVYISRLKTHFTVKALDQAEMTRARDQATIPTRKGEKELDGQLFNAVLIAKGCVDPDFSDKALIAHYGATDAADCVTKALLPGEIAKVLTAIMKISGFDDEEELIEDAKN